MPSEYFLEPPVSVRVCGQWHLVVPHVVTQRQTRQETIELRNGTLTYGTYQTPAHAHDEPLSVPTAWTTRCGIPLETLRQACVTLTGPVRQALLMAPVAAAPAPGPGQTATKLTPAVVAGAPEVTPQDVVDKEKLLQELAALDPIALEQRRDEAAQMLGVRVTILDREVAKRRPHPHDNGTRLQGRPITVPQTECWEAPVDGSTLVQDIVDLLKKYVVAVEWVYLTVALWILHTYLLGARP